MNIIIILLFFLCVWKGYLSALSEFAVVERESRFLYVNEFKLKFWIIWKEREKYLSESDLRKKTLLRQFFSFLSLPFIFWCDSLLFSCFFFSPFEDNTSNRDEGTCPNVRDRTSHLMDTTYKKKKEDRTEKKKRKEKKKRDTKTM